MTPRLVFHPIPDPDPEDGRPRPARRVVRLLYAKATAVKAGAGGKLASSRSKTGEPTCSKAVSDWKTKGSTPEVQKVLAHCRALAKGKATVHRLAAAGHDLKAQHLTHMIESGKPITAKDRGARAKELGAKRAERAKAGNASKVAPAPTPPRTIKLKPTTPAHKAAVRAVAEALDARDHANRGFLSTGNPDMRDLLFAQASKKNQAAQPLLKAARAESGIKPEGGAKPGAAPAPAPVSAPTAATVATRPREFSDQEKSYREEERQAGIGDPEAILGMLGRAQRDIAHIEQSEKYTPEQKAKYLAKAKRDEALWSREHELAENHYTVNREQIQDKTLNHLTGPNKGKRFTSQDVATANGMTRGEARRSLDELAHAGKVNRKGDLMGNTHYWIGGSSKGLPPSPARAAAMAKQEDGAKPKPPSGITYVRAPAGGAVSDVNGIHYPGGQLMPIHGLSAGLGPKPKGDGKGVASAPARPNAEGSKKSSRPARAAMTPEQIEGLRQKRADEAKWSEVRNGPIGQMLSMGERPHAFKYGGHPGLRAWREWAEQASPERLAHVQKVAEAIHEKNELADVAAHPWKRTGGASGAKALTDPEIAEALRENRAYHAEQTAQYLPKKHMKAVPNSHHVHAAVTDALGSGDVNDLHAVHQAMTGESQPAGGAPTGTPTPAPAPAPATPESSVPEGVKQSVKSALDTYRNRAEEIRRGADLGRNPTVGGGRRYVDDARKNLRPPDRDTVREFLRLAKENGVNGPSVVKQLAGEAGVGKAKGDPLAKIRETHPETGRTRQILDSIRGKATPTPTPAPPPAPLTNAERISRANPSDLPTFASQVKGAAKSVPAAGRFGANKVFLNHLHAAYQKQHGQIDPEAFKRRLVEANQARHLDLSRADMVEAMNPADVKASTARHPLGSEFHFLHDEPKGGEPAPTVAPPPPSPESPFRALQRLHDERSRIMTQRGNALIKGRQERLPNDQLHAIAQAHDAKSEAVGHAILAHLKAHPELNPSRPSARFEPGTHRFEPTYDSRTGGYYTGD